MEKVLVIGCSGAGKSTLSVALGEMTGLPVVHLDRLFWRENWQHVSRDEFDTLLAQELSKPQWIIDGEYSRTLPMRLKHCDTVIWLDYPRWQCLLGVLKRVIKNHGKVRPDMGDGCRERFDWSFIKFVWTFNRNHRDKIVKLLEVTNNAEVIVLKNRRAGKAFLNNEIRRMI